MSSNYVICVRDVDENSLFIAEPGETKFLVTPSGDLPHPSHEKERKEWVRLVMAEAERGKNPNDKKSFGDILVLIHGYNNTHDIIIKRHEQLKNDLESLGYKGVVVSFDWPCEASPLNYLEDRSDAKHTALRLVDDCISLFSKMQSEDCSINVHLLAHSMGALVIREAFDDADDRRSIAQRNWIVSQIMFIAGDVSSNSMSKGNPTSDSVYRHCVRLTNYFNRHDWVLKISNAKRLGTAPRVGREGLPSELPANAADVDCSDFFETLNEATSTFFGEFCHSWYIGNKIFAKDLFETLKGDLSRSSKAMLTRKVDENGKIRMVNPPTN